MLFDIIGMAIPILVAVLLVVPIGRYMADVFTGRRTWLDPVFDPVDAAIYRLAGVTQERMGWPAYCVAMLLTNLVMFLIIFVVLETQQFAPLNPDHQGPIDPLLAFNTAASFITNTDWQNYGGERTLSYYSQLFAIIFPQFTSAATGLAAGIAFVRGIGGSTDLGNFYVDLTRAITRILLPISLVTAVVLVGLGVPATFSGAVTVNTLNGPLAHPAVASDRSMSEIAQGKQTIARGAVAALESIEHLGTNGGGWFNANSAHPFENPRPLTNVLEFLLMGLIPMSLIYTFGIMTNRRKQALTFFAVMTGFFLFFLAIAYIGEKEGNPMLTAIGLDPAQGNMEGKEVRFGQGQTALFVTGTTAFTTGSVDAMHDSLTPLASLTPFSQMFLNMVFGGKGVGLINLMIFAILAIFLTGLMVGRTPEFLGKKIEAREVKLVSLAFLVHPLLILGFTAVTLALRIDLSSISNPGPHGFSELLYMYTSQAANNGSAFAGFNGDTAWSNVSGGIVMILGRYVSIVLMLAVAGSLAAKRMVPETLGTMRTDDSLFGVVLAGTVLILGALTFFPVLALGPVAEQMAMLAGKLFN